MSSAIEKLLEQFCLKCLSLAEIIEILGIPAYILKKLIIF